MRVLTKDLDENDVDKGKVRIGYLKLLSHKRIFFACLVHFFNLVIITSRQPIFGPRLSNVYGYSKTLIGFCFALPTITFILSAPIVLPILMKAFEFRARIMIGFMILIASMLIFAPSKILQLPDKSELLMYIGLCIMGTGMACTVIPVIPEMIDAVKGKYTNNKTEVTDAFSAFYNIANGIGQIVGPIVSGLLKDQFGFNSTYDYLSGGTLLFLLIYMIVCGGFASIFRSLVATCRRCKRSKKKNNFTVLTENSNEVMPLLQNKTLSSIDFSTKLSDYSASNRDLGTVSEPSNGRFLLANKQDTDF